MAILDWFAQKKAENQVKRQQLDLPANLWSRCVSCREPIYNKILEENLKVCPFCGYHQRLILEERLKISIDEGSLEPLDEEVRPTDFLKFVDSQPYSQRINDAQKKTKMNDAVITGLARIEGQTVALAVMDFRFMGGSMGSVVGEKVTRLIETAAEKKVPLVIFIATGGARMQEGILSLMQMAKTSGALYQLHLARQPYLAVFTDPTTAGVLASFGMLADIIISEPGALIGFAGARVIEQTIRQKLPKNFQRAEYLLDHGMVDLVVPRSEVKKTLTTLLAILKPAEETKDVKTSKTTKRSE